MLQKSHEAPAFKEENPELYEKEHVRDLFEQRVGKRIYLPDDERHALIDEGIAKFKNILNDPTIEITAGLDDEQIREVVTDILDRVLFANKN